MFFEILVQNNITSITLFQLLVCFFNPENKTTEAQPTSRKEKTFSLSVANNNSFAVVNNTVTTEKNDIGKNRQQPSTVNNKIILCIQIFGCVDIFLICTYSALCFYDRQHRTSRTLDTNENDPGNNSTYENAEIVFFSATGNEIL